ncbi:hypothetical protein J2Z50_002569 [Ensifer mexicanus]|nr:hypothetical protein [Sinorhizobium mexicanum]
MYDSDAFLTHAIGSLARTNWEGMRLDRLITRIL